jgi:hypothetical protein
MWGNEHSHSQMSSHFGSLSFDKLSNLHRTIVRVKTHWIEMFFISLKNILKRRCLKWVRMTHLDTSNTSYGKKKSRKSNWPLKVRNHPDFLTFMWCATYHWNALDKGYNFALNHISIGGLPTKLWAPKVTEVPTLRTSGLLRQKVIWALIPWPGVEYTIKGKVMAFPKSGP